ncbi:MAG: SDR family NAD(P)-dependent oxidoreductase [Nocardiopsaceae bacterium]|nr:SDR family NAD(P)-dependent oxidoreductase [Nocardiopsaceae bacterium]
MEDHAIAVVGMACRFPHAAGVEQFWSRLSEGHDAIEQIPRSRFDIDEFYDPRPGAPGKIVSRWGGFLDGIDQFDSGFFGISPREADRMDPQQRLLMEAAHEAIEDAGITRDDLAGSATGVFVGSIANNYWEILSRAGVLDTHANSGTALSILSGRLSYFFDLHGPSLTIDTACSSSLSAVHLACHSLRRGESSLALAGGTNIILSPEESITFSSGKMLSPGGRCKFASADADGFVRSEGVGVLVLKRLADAIADGDAIRAVVLGSATVNDGQSASGMMAPDQAAQERVLAAACADAGVGTGEVDYIEAHGTGTGVGDPAELNAIAAVFGPGRPAERPLLVGSVKTNIGHTEGAAGIAGVIKAVLCLEHGTIPPSLHVGELTPAVDWDSAGIRVPRELVKLPAVGRPAVAGVSSFGISGTNVHVVLGQYAPEPEAEPAGPAEGEPRPRLLALSAHHPGALRDLAERYARFLEPGSGGGWKPLRDICYSAAARRQHHEYRLTAIGETHEEIAARLRAFGAGEAAPYLRTADDVYPRRAATVFIFPGQGAQWIGMGRDLLARSPVFRDALAECDAAVRAETGWSVLGRLDGDAALEGTDVIQPVLWAMEVALAAQWRSWGIEPDLVVGHSMGEAAAACVAGALSVPDAAAVICRRSALARKVAGRGAMASVEIGAGEAGEELEKYAGLVSVAAINGPTSTILSGDSAAMRELLASFTERGIFCRLVRVDFASHSPQVDALREPLLDELRSIRPREGKIPLYSTVTGEPAGGGSLDAEYWVRNLREPVRFGPVIERLLAGGPATLIEISPHPILATAVREYTDRADDATVVGSTRRNEPELASLLDSLAAVHLSGHPVDLGRAFEPGSAYTRLPAPAWHRRRHWSPAAPGPNGSQPRISHPNGSSPTAPGHPLLGRRREGAGHVWEGQLDLPANAYLNDHQVQGVRIVPGTAYLELVAAAASEAFGFIPGIRDVTYHEGIFLTGAEPPVIRVALEPASVEPDNSVEQGGEAWTFTISSRHADAGDFTTNASGRLDPAGPGPADPAAPRDAESGAALRRDGAEETGEEFYRRFEAKGNQWLGAFRGVRRIWLGSGEGPPEALAEVEAPESIAGDLGRYHFHPALLDACGQVLAALIDSGTASGTASSEHDAFVLGSIDRVRLYQPPRGVIRGHAVRTRSRPEYVAGDIEVRDADGTLLAQVEGLRLRFLVPRQECRDTSGWIDTVRWRRVPPPEGGNPIGTWVLFASDAHDDSVAAALASRLGGRVVMVTPGGAYARAGADHYQLDADDPDGYRALLADLRQDIGDDAPIGIAHLGSPEASWSPEASGEAKRPGCHSVLHLVRALDAAAWPRNLRLWLVTRGGQYLPGHDQGVSPGQALVWGLGRTLAQEYRQWRCTLVDLPAGQLSVDQLSADRLAAELLSGDGENQVALRDDRYAARLVPDPLPDPAPAPTIVSSAPAAGTGASTRYEIRNETIGRLDGIGRSPAVRRPPGRGEVGIRVTAAALNYRDVLMAMGAYPGQDDRPPLGWECAGVVTEAGEGVAGVRVGEEVVALSEGALASHVTTTARLVTPVPARLTTEEALTVPAAYLTAYYGLCELANLAEGERVLIHSATGGVGLAAVHIARWRGAEIYATAGSPAKRAFLKTLGVRHVYDSRSLDFADAIRAETRGEGVHVILNSLAGEAIAANLSLLAPYGRYVEMSKKDLLEDRPIGLAPFSKNLAFYSIDLVDIFRTRPEKAGRMLDRVFELAGAGLLPPLPYETYDVADASEAFRRMARSKHIGKVLISLGEPSAAAPEPAPEVITATSAAARDGVAGPERWRAPAGTCLITGGLGGIGLALAAWLIDRGARDLLLVGRSPAGDREADLRALERSGATVTYRVADVADEDRMRAVLEEHAASGRPPVTGVMHAAGVLDLVPVAELSAQRLDAMVAPKLDGAWTLHRLLKDQPLEFFVLFSSASAVLGSPQLGAYAAANAALDAFALHRRAAGLKALSVDWGFWSTVGMVARYAAVHGRTLAPKGVDAFTPDEGMEILGRLLLSGRPQAMVMPADWSRWARAYPDAAAEPLLREIMAGHRVPEPTVAEPPAVAEPSAAAEPERAADGDPDAMREFLTRLTAKVLGLPADGLSFRKPLNRQGLDSLMASEMRSEIQREYGLMVPMAQMIGGQSLADLADFISKDIESS